MIKMKLQNGLFTMSSARFSRLKKSRLSQSGIFNPTDFTTQITIKWAKCTKDFHCHLTNISKHTSKTIVYLSTIQLCERIGQTWLTFCFMLYIFSIINTCYLIFIGLFFNMRYRIKDWEYWKIQNTKFSDRVSSF